MQLTFARGQSWPYSWSPDGDKIVFAGAREGYGIFGGCRVPTRIVRLLTQNTQLNVLFPLPGLVTTGDQIVSEYSESRGNIYLMELR